MMEARVVLFSLVLFVELVYGEKLICPGCDSRISGVWARRQMRYQREFKDTNDECQHRLAFENNLKTITSFRNKARKYPKVYTWQVGQNGIADKTPPEFKAMLGFKGFKRFGTRFQSVWTSTSRGDSSTVSTSRGNSSTVSTDQVLVDYTAEGFVTPVKDQGHCGSCWTFSATGAIESQVALSTHVLPNLSEQNLLDCANGTYNNSGCDGGLMRNAFQYVVDNCGIVASDAYPYTAVQGECSPPKGAQRYSCRGYEVIEPNETALLRALMRYGPISCGMDASLESFQLYTEGIYSDRQCSDELNHAILIVGAGRTTDGVDYWLIKNSWGIEWGEDGFFRMLRGSNLCNITGDCSIPCYCKPTSSYVPCKKKSYT